MGSSLAHHILGLLPALGHPLPKGQSHCPAASPTLLEASPWPFPILPRMESKAGLWLREGLGLSPTRWTLLSCSYVLPPPTMVAATTRGPERQLSPRSPRKNHHGIWALDSVMKPVMAPPQRAQLQGSCSRLGEASRWRCAVCNKPGQEALSDPQAELSPFHPVLHLHKPHSSCSVN